MPKHSNALPLVFERRILANRFQQTTNYLSCLRLAQPGKEVSHFGLRQNVLYHIVVCKASTIVQDKELTDEICDAKLRDVEL